MGKQNSKDISNDNSPLLSVIIPVFNGEKYINRCLNSVLSNDVKLEIIVINDASTDNSLKLLEAYHDKITLFNLTENKGVSFARNLGLSKAKGEYVTFIDIDDYLKENAYSIMLNEIMSNNADVCVCNYFEEFENLKKIINSKYNLQNEILFQNDFVRQYLLDKISPALWDKIYKKEILKNIYFSDELNVGEDLLFTLQMFLNANKIVSISERLYYYIQQENSVMHKLSTKLLQFNQVLNKISSTEEKILNEKFKQEFEYFKTELLTRTIHSISVNVNKNNKKQAKRLLEQVCNRENLNQIINNRFTPKSVKLECLIIKYLGIKVHLSLIPLYKKLRNNRRKNV